MLAAALETSGLESVRALEKLRIGATRLNDVEALAPLLDDDLIYVNSVGDVYEKADYLEAIRTRRLTYECDFDVHETDCRLADGLVVLAGVMVGHARLDGEQQVFHFRCLSIWREWRGTWRLFVWQSSTLASVPGWWSPSALATDGEERLPPARSL